MRRRIKQAELHGGRRTDNLAPRQQAEVTQLRREVRRLRQERDILLAAEAWFRGGRRRASRDVFAFVKAHSNRLSVRSMCRLLGRSSSGYYAWLNRPPSARACHDAVLRQQVYVIWRNSRRTYGRRRVHAALKARGENASPKRVGRLMNEMGIRGTDRQKKWKVPSHRSAARPVPDLVNRNFRAARRDELWIADITHAPTLTGCLYLAVVLDAWSRLVVGWATATHARTELVEEALAMAIQHRHTKGVVHHSDRGTQYASRAFGRRCQQAGVQLSMGAPGTPHDNAMCESFFATLKCELVHRRKFATPDAARKAIADFIEGFYNRRRRHSALDYRSPAEYERRYAT